MRPLALRQSVARLDPEDETGVGNKVSAKHDSHVIIMVHLIQSRPSRVCFEVSRDQYRAGVIPSTTRVFWQLFLSAHILPVHSQIP